MTVFGKCPLCPQSTGQQKLYGSGVCIYHLSHPEDNQSKVRMVKEAAKVISAEQALRDWYAHQFEQRTPKCENCRRVKLVDPQELWRQKAMVAHILPKRPKGGFPSVATHPLNRWFACKKCHDDYDRGWSIAMDMPVWELCVERYTQFMTAISVGEHKNLPEPLRALLDKKLAVLSELEAQVS